MNSLDLLVLSGVTAVMLGPVAWASVRGYLSSRPVSPAPKPSSDDWRQEWASCLIGFIDEVEADSTRLNDSVKAVRLARELIWEIIGGDGEQPKPQGGKR